MLLRKLFFVEIIILIAAVFISLSELNMSDMNWIINSVNIIYIIINLQYFYIYKRKNLLCFEFFFALSFWLCCFLYSFLILEVDDFFASLINYDEYTISKGYLVCLLGYLFYILGLILVKYRQHSVIKFHFSLNFIIFLNKIMGWLCLGLFLLFIATGGLSILFIYDYTLGIDQNNRFDGFGVAMGFLNIALNVATITNFIPLFYKRRQTNLINVLKAFDLKYLIILACMTLLFLISGFRSGALQLLLPFVILLTYVHKISNFKILASLTAATILFISIGYLRSGNEADIQTFNNLNSITALRDFYSGNGATFYLIDYADSHGPTYGSNVLFPFVSMVPFAQNFLGNFINPDNMALASSILYTNSSWVNYGLGTNLIGDIYYTFGLTGVTILMFLLGVVIAYSYRKMNIYWQIVYFILCGNSIFFPRIEYFYIFRYIGLSIFLIWILKIIYREFISNFKSKYYIRTSK